MEECSVPCPFCPKKITEDAMRGFSALLVLKLSPGLLCVGKTPKVCQFCWGCTSSLMVLPMAASPPSPNPPGLLRGAVEGWMLDRYMALSDRCDGMGMGWWLPCGNGRYWGCEGMGCERWEGGRVLEGAYLAWGW
jgi:hypothetical protein